MSQTKHLIDTLKRQIKAQGKTYRDVANTLKLSEASIKRLFKEGDISLPRLETICNNIGLDFFELAQMSLQKQQQLTQLTQEQEQTIAEDLLLFLVTVCVINGYRFEDILKQYQISETQLIQKLAALDRLKIIELLPCNRIKLLIAPNFHWLAKGPIQTFFHNHIKNEFFQSSFDQSDEKLIVINRLVSASNHQKLQKRMQKLADDFIQLSREDSPLPLSERRGSTLVIATRQWTSSIFKDKENKL